MKKTPKKVTRRVRTWTFQPDDDVRELVERLFPEASRGQRTALVNEAIRLKHPAAAISLAEKDFAEAKARLDALKDKVASKD